jgi:hypothetical protein
MKMTLGDVPRKCVQVSRPGLGMAYPQAYALYQKLVEQDPRILFYALRPLGDELWNMIDGQRSIGWIVEACLMEFGFEVDPILLLPIFEGLGSEGLLTIGK